MKSTGEHLRVRLTGGNVTPEKVSVRLLSEVLESVRQLAYGVDDDQPTRNKEETKDALRLVGQITSGSANYRLSASHPDRATKGLRLAGKIATDPGLAEQHPHVLRPTEELSRIAKSLGCTVEVYDVSDESSPLARILPETYDELAASALASGPSNVSGVVMRVGGATKYSASLRVPSQPSRLLICRLANQGLARSLARSLFTRVSVTGEATWYRKSWRLHSFLIKEIAPSTERPKDGRAWLDGIREAGGNKWDAIADPDRYLREARGE